jgi:hypothetical protein
LKFLQLNFMKDGKKKSVFQASPLESRKSVVRHFLAIAEHTLKRSNNIEEQSEALEMKRFLEGRMNQLEDQALQAA